MITQPNCQAATPEHASLHTSTSGALQPLACAHTKYSRGHAAVSLRALSSQLRREPSPPLPRPIAAHMWSIA
jgi:hypothetical protein